MVFVMGDSYSKAIVPVLSIVKAKNLVFGCFAP